MNFQGLTTLCCGSFFCSNLNLNVLIMATFLHLLKSIDASSKRFYTLSEQKET